MRSILTLLIASGLALGSACSEPQLPTWLDEYAEAQESCESEGTEVCDEADNDCDGQIDEGLQCGGPPVVSDTLVPEDTDTSQAPPEDTGSTDAEVQPGPEDVEGSEDVDGGEDVAQPDAEDISDTGPECGDEEIACNGIDDDCDSVTDEDDALASDPENCGSCGVECAAENPGVGVSVWACVEGACVVEACEPGAHDLNDDEPGCEYACEPIDPSEAIDKGEICNGVDDDCDGQTDEGAGHVLCSSAVTSTSEWGACSDGECSAVSCPEGQWNLDMSGTCEYDCTGQSDEGVLLGEEVCDGLDNDCDGETDEDVTTLSDPNHCGGCGVDCAAENPGLGVSVWSCAEGTCVVEECDAGQWDLEPEVLGCGYHCMLSGDEVCDGGDNDCDGEIDEGGDLLCPSVSTSSLSTCPGWGCPEPPCCFETPCEAGSYDLDGLLGNGCEYLCSATEGDTDDNCDMVDNDCDGETDEEGTGCAPPSIHVVDLQQACPSQGCSTCGCAYCAQRADGMVYCWGESSYTSIPSGGAYDAGPYHTPTPIDLGGATTKLAMSNNIALAAVGGKALLWGTAYNGMANTGKSASSAITPTPVSDPETGLPFTDVIDVDSEGTASCLLRDNGTVWCWGSSGPMGPGPEESMGTFWTATPLRYTQGGEVVTGVTDFCMGCWVVQAEDGTKTTYCGNEPSPIETPEGVELVDIECGAAHTCGLDAAGQAYCWGQGASGQLGDGGAASSDEAVAVKLDIFTEGVGVPLIKLELDGDTSCGVGAEGERFCWGDLSPRGVAQTSAFAQPMDDGIALTRGACRVLETGEIYCSGTNSQGELGQGEDAGYPTQTPLAIVTEMEAADLALGARQICALNSPTAPGPVHCWGHGGPALGDGVNVYTHPDTSLPVLHQDGSPISALKVEAGALFWESDLDGLFCAILEDGGVACWGRFMEPGGDYFCIAGDGYESESRAVRVRAPGSTEPLSEVTGLAVGLRHSCAIHGETDEVVCWGLADALLTDSDCAQIIPTEDPEMPHLVGAVDLAMAKKTSGTGSSQEQYQIHACAVLGTPEAESGPRGEVWCWGDNHVGQLGDGAPFEGSRTSAAPVIDPVSGEPFEGATSVSIAKTTTCATTANAGEVVCWGSDTYGLMGNGEGVSELHPVAIDALTGSDLLTGGYLHACARQGGGVICWGKSTYGQTGQLSFDLVQTPSPIAGLNGVVALASGFNASCAATPQGIVCWGENKADLFAQGLYESPTPLTVTGLDEELFDCDAGVELCEGFDDDCDGEIDEGFEGLGESCTEGDGACMNEGIIVCDPGGESVICSVSAGEPSDELCDGLDNDCNGETDEGYVLGTTCTVGEGACAVEGTSVCADDGEGTLCSATPSGPMSESCNGVDDNCDGETDEGELCPNSDPSVTTLCDGGQCVAQGCDAGTWDIDGLSENACEYACTVTGDGLSDATCDEVDDDCDGEVDEDALGCGLPSPVIQLVHNEDVTLSGFFWEYADAVYCALKAEGSVWCWGETHEHYIPAGGVIEQSPEGVPTEIALPKPITSVALSLSVAFALDADGSLWAWGGQRHGLLGDGVHSDEYYDISAPLALINPADDTPFTDIVDVDVSEAHACMLRDDKTLSCWGASGSGALGHGVDDSEGDYWRPTPLLASEGGEPLGGIVDFCTHRAGTCVVVEGEAGNETYCVGSPEHLGAGPGLTTTQLTPIEVHLGVDQALPALESISCSPNHACGLDAQGQAYCWGSNDSGQLGSGTTGETTWASKVGASIFEPQVPEPLVRLSLRQDLSCGWTAEGAQYCWGDLNALSVAKVSALAEPTAYATLVEGEPYLVQAGNCRLHAGGHVSCRGINSQGELGQGEKGSFEHAYTTPVMLEGLIAWDLAMEPSQLCAIDADQHPGQVRCVGTSQGQYGGMGSYDTGSNLPQVMPGTLPIITEEGPIEAVEIDAGSDLVCAILTSDEVACWTESGDTTVTGSVSVSGSYEHKYAHHVEHYETGARLTTVSDLSVGEEKGCAVVGEAGEVLCWGNDSMIVKGTGAKGAHPVPTEDLAMPTLQDAVAVSISKVSLQNDTNQHACAVIGSADAPSGPQGEVWCWGSNLDNQMGRGEASALQEYPAPVLTAPSVPLSGMTDVQAARGATCALPADPNAPMVCWGSDDEGLMGNGAQGDHPYATPIAGIVGITELSGGQDHFCAIGQSVTTCWGSSEQGLTGQGSLNGTTPSLAPVAGVVDPLSVHSGVQASCVIEASGQTKCWGKNDGDRFGQGIYFSNTFLPVLDPDGLVMGCTPEVESCDGIDNDCDGVTDEDFPSDGEAVEDPCSGD